MTSKYNRIIHGDCIKAMAKLPDGCIDLAFADPPFNIGYDYDVYDDKRSCDDYLDWSHEWMSGVKRILRPWGAFWLAIGDDYAAELKVLATRELGFTCRSWVVWYYTFGVNCTHKFTRSHTHLLYFVKPAETEIIQSNGKGNKRGRNATLNKQQKAGKRLIDRPSHLKPRKTKPFAFPPEVTFNANDIRVPSARQLVYGDKRANPKGRLPDDTWIIPPTNQQHANEQRRDREGASEVVSAENQNRNSKQKRNHEQRRDRKGASGGANVASPLVGGATEVGSAVRTISADGETVEQRSSLLNQYSTDGRENVGAGATGGLPASAHSSFILRPQDIPESFEPDCDTWYYSRVCGTFKERGGFHGCQMPEQLLGRIIKACSNEGDIVFDPFTGSGTTLAVAKKLGRQYLGTELSKQYVTESRTRLRKAEPGTPLDGVENPLTSVPNTKNGTIRTKDGKRVKPNGTSKRKGRPPKKCQSNSTSEQPALFK